MRNIPFEWPISEKLKKIADNKEYLQKKFKIKEIGTFGSYIHNTQKKKSDLDILVNFSETPSLFEFLETEEYLSNLLGVKVDLVMKNSLKKHLKKHILEEVIYL